MSSKLIIDKRRRTYVRLIGEIREALHNALEEEHARRQLTQQGMAESLDTSKSFISRKMNGTSNMTLETLADLAFALDRVVKIQLRSRHGQPGSNAEQKSEQQQQKNVMPFVLSSTSSSSGTSSTAIDPKPKIIAVPA